MSNMSSLTHAHLHNNRYSAYFEEQQYELHMWRGQPITEGHLHSLKGTVAKTAEF